MPGRGVVPAGYGQNQNQTQPDPNANAGGITTPFGQKLAAQGIPLYTGGVNSQMITPPTTGQEPPVTAKGGRLLGAPTQGPAPGDLGGGGKTVGGEIPPSTVASDAGKNSFQSQGGVIDYASLPDLNAAEIGAVWNPKTQQAMGPERAFQIQRAMNQALAGIPPEMANTPGIRRKVIAHVLRNMGVMPQQNQGMGTQAADNPTLSDPYQNLRSFVDAVPSASVY